MKIAGIKRMALGLTLVGMVAAAGAAMAPTAHAQSSDPTLNATVVQWGGNDQFNIVGQAFTPGATVQVTISNAGTGAVMATSTTQSTTATPIVVTLACDSNSGEICTQLQEECASLPAWYAGIVYPSVCDSLPNYTYTTVAPGGNIGTNVLLATPSVATTVTVQAVDTATGAVSNAVTLSM
jgi:hypothetical protein